MASSQEPIALPIEAGTQAERAAVLRWPRTRLVGLPAYVWIISRRQYAAAPIPGWMLIRPVLQLVEEMGTAGIAEALGLEKRIIDSAVNLAQTHGLVRVSHGYVRLTTSGQQALADEAGQVSHRSARVFTDPLTGSPLGGSDAVRLLTRTSLGCVVEGGTRKVHFLGSFPAAPPTSPEALSISSIPPWKVRSRRSFARDQIQVGDTAPERVWLLSAVDQVTPEHILLVDSLQGKLHASSDSDPISRHHAELLRSPDFRGSSPGLDESLDRIVPAEIRGQVAPESATAARALHHLVSSRPGAASEAAEAVSDLVRRCLQELVARSGAFATADVAVLSGPASDAFWDGFSRRYDGLLAGSGRLTHGPETLRAYAEGRSALTTGWLLCGLFDGRLPGAWAVMPDQANAWSGFLRFDETMLDPPSDAKVITQRTEAVLNLAARLCSLIPSTAQHTGEESDGQEEEDPKQAAAEAGTRTA